MRPGGHDWVNPTTLLWFALLGTLLEGALAEDEDAPFHICLSNFPPMVTCTPSGNISTYVGYEIDMIAELIDKEPPREYTYSCVNFTFAMNDLVKREGSACDMVAAGITRSTEREAEGIRFTDPTYRASLAIMTLARVKDASWWGFLRPLHWGVWASMLFTALLVPWFVFVVESLACHGFIHRGDWLQGLKDATYDSFAALVNFGHYRVHSTAARIVVMFYGFLVLIVINTYVANLAAFLTISQVDPLINSVRDLMNIPGSKVASIDVYVDRLVRQRIAAVIVNQTDNYLDRMVASLRTGEYKALIMDEPWVSVTTSTGGCDLKKLAQTIEPFDYAFAFPVSAPSDLVRNFSRGVLALQEAGVVEMLAKKHIDVPRRGCPPESEFSETEAVRLEQLLGLWIILAVAIGIAAILLVFSVVHKKPSETMKPSESARWRWMVRVNTPKRLATSYHAKATADLKSKKDHFVPGMNVAGELQIMREDMQVIRSSFSCLLSDLQHANGGGA